MDEIKSHGWSAAGINKYNSKLFKEVKRDCAAEPDWFDKFMAKARNRFACRCKHRCSSLREPVPDAAHQLFDGPDSDNEQNHNGGGTPETPTNSMMAV